MSIHQRNRGHCIIYTDGACSSNGRAGAKAAFGVFCAQDQSMNLKGRITGRQTNQRAEVIAARQGVEQAFRNGYTSVLIRTDSEYTVKGITEWFPNKVARGQRMANHDDFVDLHKSMQNIRVSFEWIPRDKNRIADCLAGCGLELEPGSIAKGMKYGWDETNESYSHYNNDQVVGYALSAWIL